MEGKIELNGLRFRAYHGVLEEERRCGGDFVVDFSCAYPFEKAFVTDDLADTLDYSAVYAIIAREMAIPSQLLEHVAGRIATALRAAFPLIRDCRIRVAKKNPPLGGEADASAVTLEF